MAVTVSIGDTSRGSSDRLERVLERQFARLQDSLRKREGTTDTSDMTRWLKKLSRQQDDLLDALEGLKRSDRADDSLDRLESTLSKQWKRLHDTVERMESPKVNLKLPDELGKLKLPAAFHERMRSLEEAVKGAKTVKFSSGQMDALTAAMEKAAKKSQPKTFGTLR